jgi:riboflavin kinase
LKKIELSGKVFSGKGGGKKFLELQWVKQQIEEKLAFTPYAGTLNIRLSSESAKRRKQLENTAAMTVHPAEGYRNGKLFKATTGTTKCGVVIPEVAGYPENLLEIIAPVNLREKLQLADGDEITVTISL